MITCQECEHQNPLGAMFCHSCGVRLKTKKNDIFSSAKASKSDQQQEYIWRAARNALSLSIFLVVSGLIFNLVVAPPLPRAELPPLKNLTRQQLFGDGTLPSLASSSTLPDKPFTPLNDVKPVDWLLQWRAAVGPDLLKATLVDPAQIEGWQGLILNGQSSSGAWSGGDQTCATALAVMALQAYPTRDAVRSAAEKGRAFLLGKMRSFGPDSDALAVALTFAALNEAGELPAAQLTRMTAMLVSGQAAPYQALALCSLEPAKRPKNYAPVVLKLGDGNKLWSSYFSLFGEKATPLDIGMRSDEVAAGLGPTERVIWAICSWQAPVPPFAVPAALQHFSNQKVPNQAEDALRLKAGPLADPAMAILVCTASFRVPVDWLASR